MSDEDEAADLDLSGLEGEKKAEKTTPTAAAAAEGEKRAQPAAGKEGEAGPKEGEEGEGAKTNGEAATAAATEEKVWKSKTLY